MHPFLIEIYDLFSLLRLTDTLLQLPPPKKKKNLCSATIGNIIINYTLLLVTLNPHGILYTISRAVRRTGIVPCCKKLYSVKMSFTF